MNKKADISTVHELAAVLGIDTGRLIYHVRIARSSSAYSSFTIPKRNGKVRTIDAPSPGLKAVQRRLNRFLQDLYQTKPSVHGFLPGRSIVSNALPHTRRRWVLNMDLKDFFPSIHFGRVRGMLVGIPYHLPDDVSTMIAQLCCLRAEDGAHSFLPQGAPSSPIITNMICARMDAQLQRLAQRSRATYTRYADDITFSTTLRHFPKSLATLSDGSLQVTQLSSELSDIIESNGFAVNHEKTRIQPYFQRQEVTGIIVNDGVNVSRKFVRNIRAMLHAWEKHGLEHAQSHFELNYGGNSANGHRSFITTLKGKILFLQSVRGKDDYIVTKYWDSFTDLGKRAKS